MAKPMIPKPDCIYYDVKGARYIYPDGTVVEERMNEPAKARRQPASRPPPVRWRQRHRCHHRIGLGFIRHTLLGVPMSYKQRLPVVKNIRLDYKLAFALEKFAKERCEGNESLAVREILRSRMIESGFLK